MRLRGPPNRPLKKPRRYRILDIDPNAGDATLIGRTLGRYEILEKIGAGAMGQVYRARDTRLERDVALKVLPRQAIATQKERDRFRKEALALSRLSHPGIATVHDFDSVEGIDFLVMELVPGETLDEMLRSGPLALDDVVTLWAQLAKALAEAHRNGVVHRDLKPGNIKVTPDNHLKILDFGVAKLFKPTDEGVSQEKLTETGARAGTIAYMSPEQIRGEKTGPQSDLFSLGIILYEMITGHHPFASSHSQSIAYQILNQDPATPSQLRSKIPAQLERIVLKLLEKDPQHRYESAGDIVDALAALDMTAHSRRRIPRIAIRTSLGVVAVFGVILIAGFLRGTETIYSTALAPRNTWRLTFSGSASIPCWSPDGQNIAYFQDNKVYVVPVEGGTPRVLGLGDRRLVPWGWSPDGNGIIVQTDYPDGESWSVVKIGLYDGKPQVLVEQATFGNISSDGRFLAYCSLSPEELYQIWIQDQSTGEKRKLVEPKGEGTAAYKPKWSPDGKKIAYVRWNGTGHEIWLVDADGTNDHQIDLGPIEAAGQYSWTTDGRAIVVGAQLQGMWGIWRISMFGGQHERLTVSSEEELHVSLAPDGERFAFGRQIDVSRVALLDVQDSTLRYPFELGVAPKKPNFSPDGSHIYFQALANAKWQVWQAATDGSGQPEPILSVDGISCFRPTPGDSGEVIYLRAAVGRTWRFGRISWSQTLWRSSDDGGRHQRISNAGDRVERLAPNPVRSGRILYSVNTEKDREAICVLHDSEEPTILFTDSDDRWVRSYDWGPDEDEVLIAHSDPGKTPNSATTVSTIDIRTLEWTRVLALDTLSQLNNNDSPGDVIDLALSHDRNRLAMLVQLSPGVDRNLYIYDFGTAKAKLAYEFREHAHPDLITWSPDGRHIAIDMHRERSDIYISGPSETNLANR